MRGTCLPPPVEEDISLSWFFCLAFVTYISVHNCQGTFALCRCPACFPAALHMSLLTMFTWPLSFWFRWSHPQRCWWSCQEDHGRDYFCHVHLCCLSLPPPPSSLVWVAAGVGSQPHHLEIYLAPPCDTGRESRRPREGEREGGIERRKYSGPSTVQHLQENIAFYTSHGQVTRSELSLPSRVCASFTYFPHA